MIELMKADFMVPSKNPLEYTECAMSIAFCETTSHLVSKGCFKVTGVLFHSLGYLYSLAHAYN